MMKAIICIIVIIGSTKVHSIHPPRVNCVMDDNECRNVNCTGSVMPEGNFTIGFNVSGSCTEPAQINLTTSTAVEHDGGIETVKQNIRVVDCFWIPEDELFRSYTSTSFRNGSYLEFYLYLSTNASDDVHIEFGINGSSRANSYIRRSSNPLCGKPVTDPNSTSGALQQSVTGLLVIILMLALML